MASDDEHSSDLEGEGMERREKDSKGEIRFHLSMIVATMTWECY